MNRSAAAFKRTTKLTLSSGLEVEVRKPDISTLVLKNQGSGSVPTPITNMVVASIAGVEPQPLEFASEDLPALASFISLTVRAALVWPVIVDENPDYEAGEILLDDLTMAEKMDIQHFAMPEAAVQQGAESFRAGQNGDVGTPQVVSGLQSVTE